METDSPNFFIEINKTNFMFLVSKYENGHLKLIYKNNIPLIGIKDEKIVDFELIFKNFKKNIYHLEQKLNHTFKEVILILDNFNYSLSSFAGYKKLNGAQLQKENITFILNSLKSKIIECEKDKKILHIFNSKFLLDDKNIENLPIGLFGDFYSHELSFLLINNNDYKNLTNILNGCNLRVKRVFSKSFIEGADIINENLNIESFFKIQINENDSQILFFQNSALKFVQNFNFGSDLISKDISKVLAIKNEVVKNILLNCDFSGNDFDEKIIEKKYFQDQNFRKIKKQLILDIAYARIEEIAEIILIKNINVHSFLKTGSPIFLSIKENSNFRCFKNIYQSVFSKKNSSEVKLIKQSKVENLSENALKIVQYGWKKEALPIINEKKSIIARFFNLFFD